MVCASVMVVALERSEAHHAFVNEEKGQSKVKVKGRWGEDRILKIFYSHRLFLFLESQSP